MTHSPTDSIVQHRHKPSKGRWPVKVSRVERLSRRAYLLAQFLGDRGMAAEANAAANIADDAHALVCPAVCGCPHSGNDEPV